MQYFPQGIILPKPITVKNYHANNVIDVLNVWNINILFGKMYLVCWENFTRINLISILSGLFVQKFWHETSIIYGSIYRCKNLVLIQFIPRKVIRILRQYDIFIRLISILHITQTSNIKSLRLRQQKCTYILNPYYNKVPYSW